MENDSAACGGTSVIHIGLHKAASTTLQLSLRALRMELASQGFFYPTDHLPLRTQHSDLAIFLRGAHVEKYRSAMDGILHDFRNLGHANLLLSGEEFSALLPSQIEVLHADLAKMGRQFRVILYIRNLYRLKMSGIAQRSKSGKLLSHPSRIVNSGKFNPSSILSRWEKVFGEDNVIAACLEALPAQTNIVTHLAGLAGIKLPLEFRVVDRNRSVDPIASALLSQLTYEFQLPHQYFCKSYFEEVRDRPPLPRIEGQLFGMIDKWVTGVDLSHPKLVPFRDTLCNRPPIRQGGAASAESIAGYLRHLGMTLLETAERVEETDGPPGRGSSRKSGIRSNRTRRERESRQ